jgi:hypothetical protein
MMTWGDKLKYEEEERKLREQEELKKLELDQAEQALENLNKM